MILPWFMQHARETGHNTEDSQAHGMRCLDCAATPRTASVVQLCMRCGHELHTLHPFCRCGCTYRGEDGAQ